MAKVEKQWGKGSLAFALFVAGIFWAVNLEALGGICIGDKVLSMMGLPIWSNGDIGIHFTVYYGFLFWIPAILLGMKHPNDRYAKVGRVASLWVVALMLVSTVMLAV